MTYHWESSLPKFWTENRENGRFGKKYGRKIQHPGDSEGFQGGRETIGICWRLPDNPGGITCMPLQHGFRKGRSCETQLIEFMDDLTSNLEERHQTDILIMDFAKAFDKVDHSLLTHKLHHYGIRGNVNTWIKNWLKDRKQSVVVDGEKSEPVSVDSGVPQGSVLGPGLFLYYINDLPARLRSRVRLFAEDTIAYLVIILQKDA